MGIGTDAILFYGYCWEDEYDPFEKLHNQYRNVARALLWA